jgi:DNA-binding response OmpR family regulator
VDSRAATILVVDDEYAIVETLSDVLAYEGYAVTTAANGAKAWAAIETIQPALVLLDFMMPILDGVQLAKKVRADPRFAKLPIVMMTAAPAGLPKAAGLWDELLVKPFELEQLLAVIRDVLTRSK